MESNRNAATNLSGTEKSLDDAKCQSKLKDSAIVL